MTAEVKTLTIPVKFRFPIVQIGDQEIEVNIKLGTNGEQLLSINPLALRAWNLSDKETDKAHGAAVEAVVRSVMIVE